MASRFKTGRMEEALVASEEIVELAEEVLSPKQFARAIELSEMLVYTKSQREEAIYELKELIAPPPKRPLYYAQHELGFLPRWTRDAIRDLGDYIDILTKHLAYELTKDNRVRSSPMGANIKIIESMKDKELDKLLYWLQNNLLLTLHATNAVCLSFNRPAKNRCA